MKLSNLRTSTAAVDKGRWITDLPDLGDFAVKVRGTSNADYRRHMQKLIRAMPPAKRRGGVIDPEEQDRITGICLARHALLDWRNLQDADGNEILFSPEQAETFLLDPEFRKLRDGVLAAANQVDDGEAEADEQTEKNSSRPSATP